MSNNPRRANGAARNKLRKWLRDQQRPCWICVAFGRYARIDYDLPAGHPMAFEVDELKPVSKWREYGYPSPTAAALDRSNVDSVHRRCNEWRGNKTVEQVLAIAAKERQTAGRQSRGKVSRSW